MKCIAFIFCLLISGNGQACPFCHSKTAKEIRASLFGPDLPFNLLVTGLPFLIFAVVVYGIYHGGFTLRRPDKNAKKRNQ